MGVFDDVVDADALIITRDREREEKNKSNEIVNQ